MLIFFYSRTYGTDSRVSIASSPHLQPTSYVRILKEFAMLVNLQDVVGQLDDAGIDPKRS